MNSIRSFVEEAGIAQWGVCAYDSILPLLKVRSAEKIPENAKSLIVILFGYYTEEYPNRNVARYAIPDDYHKVTGAVLENLTNSLRAAFPEEQFQPFIDQSPIQEVRAAVMAGLGGEGMNGLLFNRAYGSYCFIGEIVTTKYLRPPFFSAVMRPGDPKAGMGGKTLGMMNAFCLECQKCVQACPGGALSPNGFDPTKCRSAITQKKGLLNPWEENQVRLGKMAWGCDICNDCCPLNKTAQKSDLSQFYEHLIPVLTEENVEELSVSKAYGWRGKGVLLRNLKLISQTTAEPAQIPERKK